LHRISAESGLSRYSDSGGTSKILWQQLQFVISRHASPDLAAFCLAKFSCPPFFPVTSAQISGCTSVTAIKHASSNSRLNKKYDNSTFKKIKRPVAFAGRFTA
jgi:hypothetical protein